MLITLCLAAFLIVTILLILWATHRRMKKREQALRQYFAQRQQDIPSPTNNINIDASPSQNPQDANLRAADSEFMQRLDLTVRKAMTKATAHNALSIEALASDMCISRGQLNRRVKAITGVTTQQYVLHLRLEQGRQLLENTQLPVSEIGYQCGFEDATSFSRAFKRAFGLSPSQFRTMK